MLNVVNLGHTFGDRTLFKEVSFRLVEGEHVGLVGANGVGKQSGRDSQYHGRNGKTDRQSRQLPVEI